MLWVGLLACAHGPLALPHDWKSAPFADEGSRALAVELWRQCQSAPRSWQRPAPVRSGSLLEQWWCDPEVSEEACWTGGVVQGQQRGSAWRGLAAMLDESGRVEQLVYDAGATQGEWGLGLTLRLEASSGDISYWEIRVLRFAADSITAAVELGPTLHYGYEQSSFSAQGPALQELSASPESFAAAAGASWAALQVEVQRAIAAHEVRRCAYGRYWGDGSPRCDLVPLSADEERQASEQARIELSHRESTLRGDAEILHGLLAELTPAELNLPEPD